jgi:hypothetical protein
MLSRQEFVDQLKAGKRYMLVSVSSTWAEMNVSNRCGCCWK